MITPSELKAARERAGLTQQQLAVAAGLTVSCIAHMESKGGNPRMSTMQALAAAIENASKGKLPARSRRTAKAVQA